MEAVSLDAFITIVCTVVLYFAIINHYRRLNSNLDRVRSEITSSINELRLALKSNSSYPRKNLPSNIYCVRAELMEDI